MCAYVLCQMDYSSCNGYISCNGWAIVDFKKVYLGLITFVRLLHVYVWVM